MRFNIKKKNYLMFKKRNLNKKSKLKFTFGNIIISINKFCRFDLNYFILIKKLLKKLIKPKNLKFKTRNCWIFISLNYVVTRKSKNSRMGKGKGSLFKWTCLIRKSYKILELKDLNKYRLNNIIKSWRKKLYLPIYTITKHDL